MSKWNTSIEWDRGNYITRCLEESFGPSNAGNPMITLKHEVVSPETVNIAGIEYDVAGQQFTTYHVTKNVDKEGVVDEEKSKKSKESLQKLFKAFGLPHGDEDINVDNPTLGFKTKLQHTFLYDDTSEQRKNPTPEQIKKGQKGDIIVNPITKQPRVNHYPKVGEFYGLAEANPNKPF